MAITLDGVALGQVGSQPVWRDRNQSASVAQRVQRTLGGNAVVFVGALRGGLPITLEATADYGWLSKAQVDAALLRATVPDGQYLLVIDGVEYNVMFRHTDAPAVDMQPLNDVHDAAADVYVGQLKFITV